MRSVTWVTFYAGLLIGASYLGGSLIRSWASKRANEAGPSVFAIGAEAVGTLACAAIAYSFIDWLAPGGTVFRSSSAVGFLSPKTLTVWESIGLWSGLAAVVGSVVPITSRFRSGSMGIAGSAALLVFFSPLIFLIALGTWFVGIGLVRDVRTTLPIVYVVVAASEWILSMTRVRVSWGVIHGPESTIWMAVLAGVLIARWSHGGPDAGPTGLPSGEPNQ